MASKAPELTAEEKSRLEKERLEEEEATRIVHQFAEAQKHPNEDLAYENYQVEKQVARAHLEEDGNDDVATEGMISGLTLTEEEVTRFPSPCDALCALFIPSPSHAA